MLSKQDQIDQNDNDQQFISSNKQIENQNQINQNENSKINYFAIFLLNIKNLN